jgi:hypothetical protein
VSTPPAGTLGGMKSSRLLKKKPYFEELTLNIIGVLHRFSPEKDFFNSLLGK